MIREPDTPTQHCGPPPLLEYRQLGLAVEVPHISACQLARKKIGKNLNINTVPEVLAVGGGDLEREKWMECLQDKQF
jgi:hypothetical protein